MKIGVKQLKLTVLEKLISTIVEIINKIPIARSVIPIIKVFLCLFKFILFFYSTHFQSKIVSNCQRFETNKIYKI